MSYNQLESRTTNAFLSLTATPQTGILSLENKVRFWLLGRLIRFVHN